MKPIREIKEGKLVGLGYEWDELFPPARYLMWACVAGGFFIFAGLSVGANKPYTILLILGLAALWTTAIMLFFFGLYRKRSLIFMSDGRMLTPYGLPGLLGRTQIIGSYVDILSVQMVFDERNSDETNKNYHVVLNSKFGEIIQVSRWMHRHDALRVQTQLSLAFEEIRKKYPMPPRIEDAADGSPRLDVEAVMSQLLGRSLRR